MTRQSNDGSGTQFSEWLRKQPEIDSKKGFVATNIDYMWHNYKTGQWMIIEEKRMFKKIPFPKLRYSQRSMFNIVHKACRHGDIQRYLGFYLVVMENTNPDDGKIWINNIHNEVTKQELIRFLQFDFSVIKR